ncbi:hypothetical protein HDU93_001417 [Gonapodya sp. JEL0774]|nr:hypothetical protein HDU93_001417 [Gonapodya sp. JEL0774]
MGLGLSGNGSGGGPTGTASNGRPFWVGLILLSPFRFAYNVVIYVFAYVAYYLPFIPVTLRPIQLPRFPSNPFTTLLRYPPTPRQVVYSSSNPAQRFIRAFTERYGRIDRDSTDPESTEGAGLSPSSDAQSPIPTRTLPSFLSLSYNGALDQARRNTKPLLVYIHHPESEESDAFARDILCDAEVQAVVAERCLIWGGDVTEREGYQGAIEPTLAHQRASKARADGARRLREQQEAALRESERVDREKAREKEEAKKRDAEHRRRLEEEERERMEQVKREKEEAVRKEEAARRKKEEEKKRWEEKVEPKDGKGVAKVVVRLPSGGRVERRFEETDSVEILYSYVSTLDLSPIPPTARWQLATTFPRKVLDDQEKTVKEVGLAPNGVVMVEEVDDEDE